MDTDSIISILGCCLSLLWDYKVIFHQETRVRNEILRHSKFISLFSSLFWNLKTINIQICWWQSDSSQTTVNTAPFMFFFTCGLNNNLHIDYEIWHWETSQAIDTK